jgi:diguanylate cyclase (GGDEF)-like protein
VAKSICRPDACPILSNVRRTSATPARRRRAEVALIVAVVLSGLVLSGAGAVAAYLNERRHAAQLMDRYAADVGGAVADETARYVDTLSYLAAAIGSDEDFTAYDFGAITSPLTREQLPGASGVSFAVPARRDEVATIQSHWRSRGSIGLTLQPAGPGPDHIFSVTNRIFDGAPAAPGRDLSRVAEPAEALRAARESGRVTASRTYVLLADRALPVHQQQLSFVLAAPVTRVGASPEAGRFLGWVVLGMRGADFVAETLRDQSHGAVAIALVDVSLGGEPRIVATTATQPPASPSRLDRQIAIRVGDRDWQLYLRPGPDLLNFTDRNLGWLVFAACATITLLLSTLVAVLAGSRARALTKVDEATAALRDDIQRRKQTEARLRERESELHHMAFHDMLTGLANRALFYDRTEHAIAAADRGHDPLAVLFVDLDGFKLINDRQGHAVGDLVLIEIANRLRACARESDTIGRLGGDEYAILAVRMADPHDAELIADRIIGALAAPIGIGRTSVSVSASVGVALRRPHHRRADDLLLDADHAMYVAKSAGKGRYALAGPTSPSD